MNKFPFETRTIHSLVKVFADEPLNAESFQQASALLNETYSFQLAYRSDRQIKNVRAEAKSALPGSVTIREIGLVPADFPIYADHDGFLLRDTPGLYPDPLYPINDGLVCLPNQWRALWVTVEPDSGAAPGSYDIALSLESEEGETLGAASFKLELLPASLPPQRLIHTEWFHTDCIATHYNVDVWSEEHWRLVEKFVRTAVNSGINMLLTPLFTPPLDTRIGGERPTVQLIDVEKSGSVYSFGFERLQRWVNMARAAGVEYFEMSHLFTQWGAKHAPKIVGTVNGSEEKLFGWETDAAGDEYGSFLEQLLPELVQFIEGNGLKDIVYFHVSDEPTMYSIDSYRSASELLQRHIKGFKVFDALSEYEFYEQGLVPIPVPANNHIEPFLEHGVENLWTYYCCVQYKGVANRFFAFPSVRSRILGMQLYKYNIAGFLQWGYNFWYSQYSTKAIDPFRVTDADGSFPAGDAFIVYPGPDGPLESLRLQVMREALQDLRALQGLEQRIGRAAVMELLEEGLDSPLTFSSYPQEADWLLRKREQINHKLAKVSELAT
ncbi:protein of unknown function [Paenibacillaceae bacterium GAS479]|nr:protein of unknown function [Paenibacillaceae bacterium GAS479]